jgi:hypothetical protein
MGGLTYRRAGAVPTVPIAPVAPDHHKTFRTDDRGHTTRLFAFQFLLNAHVVAYA